MRPLTAVRDRLDRAQPEDRLRIDGEPRVSLGGVGIVVAARGPRRRGQQTPAIPRGAWAPHHGRLAVQAAARPSGLSRTDGPLTITETCHHVHQAARRGARVPQPSGDLRIPVGMDGGRGYGWTWPRGSRLGPRTRISSSRPRRRHLCQAWAALPGRGPRRWWVRFWSASPYQASRRSVPCIVLGHS